MIHQLINLFLQHYLYTYTYTAIHTVTVHIY
jgi:hypothetical protein